ncbi:MAG: ABC transporter substrate-binding protein [Bacillota bacterium]
MTKQNRRLRIIVSVVLAVGVILGVLLVARGCSNNGQATPVTTGTPQPSVPVDPVDGGTLSIPMPKNPGTLNPLRATSADMASIGWLVYESLVKYDEQGRVVNGVAESFETADNGKTWTFHIKKGIQFQRGGGELTANDVLYTHNLIMSYSPDECLYKDAASKIQEMKVVDNYTLSVTAAKSGHTVMDALCFPILSRNYCSSRNVDTALPNGTGPYTVQASNASGMTLKANENWWKQRAHIDTIKAVAVPDNDAALSSFEANELNMAPTQQITASRFAQSDDTTVYEVMTQRYECIVPNLLGGKLSNLSMRQAIAYSLDTKEVIERAFLGHAVAVDTPVSPGNYLFDPGAETYEYNIKKAAGLLDSSGWFLPQDETQKIRVNAQGQKLQLRLLIDENPDSTVRKDMAQAIKEQLRKTGIDVVIETKSWEDYLKALKNKSFDLALCGFNLDRSLDLTSLLRSGGSINYGGYSDGEMNALLDAYAKSTKETDRKTNMGKIQEMILNKLPVISLCYRTYSLVSDNTVQNVEGLFNMNYYNNIERWFIKDGG